MSVAFSAPVPKSVKGKPPDPDGRWLVVEEKTSASIQNLHTNRRMWEVGGEELICSSEAPDGSWSRDTKVVCKLVHTDTTQPNWFDLHIQLGDLSLCCPGVCTVHGDEMHFCYGSPDGTRPSSATEWKEGVYLRFKRVQK